MKKNRKKVTMIILSGIVVLILVYFFPLQRFLAEKKYNEYLEIQGVQNSDILSKQFTKDYKQGGYNILTKYKSDPEHYYDYHYMLINRKNSGTEYNTMTCIVYNNYNEEVIEFSNTSYKPID